MGEGKLCFSSAGNSESGHTKNYSFCCFLGFVIEYGGTCYICSVEDSKHRVICIVEVNKLKRSLIFLIYILNLEVYIKLHSVHLVRNSSG